MAAGFLIMRILLVCMLTELVHSSAIPEVRTLLSPQQINGYGNRRPLTYIRRLRENLNNTNEVKDQVEAETKMPQENFIRGPSPHQTQHSLSHQTLNSYWQQSGHTTKQTQPQQEGNEALFQPRGFQLQRHNHFLNLLNAVKDTTSGSKGSDMDKDGDESGDPSFYRPTSKVEEEQKQEGIGSSTPNKYLKPAKLQSSPTMFGTGRPFIGSPSFGKQAYKPVKDNSSPTTNGTQKPLGAQKPIQSTLVAAQRPYVSSGDVRQPAQQENHLIHTKLQSGSTLFLARRPSLSSAAQQAYKLPQTHLQSSSTQPSGLTMFGAGRPFGSSAATVQQQTQPSYGPVHTKLQSSSTQIGEERPFQSAPCPGQQSFKPVQTKLPSSHPVGEKPVSNFTAQQYTEMYKPVQSSSALIGAQKPFFGSAGAAQRQTLQNYKPPETRQPLGSTPFGVQRPSLGSTSPPEETQQTYSRLHTNLQSSSTLLGVKKPYLSSTTQQPVYTQPQSSFNMVAERSFVSSAAQQNQQVSYKLPDGKQTSTGPSNRLLGPGNQISQSQFPSTLNRFFSRTAARINPSQASNNQQMGANVYSSHVIPPNIDCDQTVSHASSTNLQSVFDTKYERPPSWLYSAHEKPSGSSYFQGQATRPLDTALAIPPVNNDQELKRFHKPSGLQNPARPLPPTIAPSMYHRPSFGLLNRESAATSNAENGRELAQNYFQSSNPQIGGSNRLASLPNRLLHSLNVQTPSNQDHTQMGLAEQNPHAHKLDRNTSYTKLSIDVESGTNKYGPSIDRPKTPPLFSVNQNQPGDGLSHTYSQIPCVNNVNGQCPRNQEIPREMEEIVTYNQFPKHIHSHERGTASFAQQQPSSVLPMSIYRGSPAGQAQQPGSVKCHAYSLSPECQKDFHPEIFQFNHRNMLII